MAELEDIVLVLGGDGGEVDGEVEREGVEELGVGEVDVHGAVGVVEVVEEVVGARDREVDGFQDIKQGKYLAALRERRGDLQRELQQIHPRVLNHRLWIHHHRMVLRVVAHVFPGCVPMVQPLLFQQNVIALAERAVAAPQAVLRPSALAFLGCSTHCLVGGAGTGGGRGDFELVAEEALGVDFAGEAGGVAFGGDRVAEDVVGGGGGERGDGGGGALAETGGGVIRAISRAARWSSRQALCTFPVSITTQTICWAIRPHIQIRVRQSIIYFIRCCHQLYIHSRRY